mmetsp:Transcript_13447/g.31651  ORF Transcript_13447/g.31651 Transcript_13447/m.31651 type:complete len:91 (-) Transcript_13447:447-719(-)
MDVFGLGADSNLVPAVWHCLLEEEHCMHVEKSTSKKVGKTMPSTWYTEIIQCPSIDLLEQLPFQLNKRKKKGKNNKYCSLFRSYESLFYG